MLGISAQDELGELQGQSQISLCLFGRAGLDPVAISDSCDALGAFSGHPVVRQGWFGRHDECHVDILLFVKSQESTILTRRIALWMRDRNGETFLEMIIVLEKYFAGTYRCWEFCRVLDVHG